MAANRVAGSVGRGASAVGSVVGRRHRASGRRRPRRALGSLAGGVAPNVTSALVQRPVQRHYARPGDESARALQVQEELGIDPTPGATGNRRMSMVENTAARMPIPFNPAALRQDRTAQQFEDAAMRTLNRIDDQGPMIQTPDVTGTQMRLAANQGTVNLDDYFRRGYAIVDPGVPPETLVRPRETYQTALDMAAPTSSESAATNRVIGQALESNVEPSVVDRTRLVQRRLFRRRDNRNSGHCLTARRSKSPKQGSPIRKRVRPAPTCSTPRSAQNPSAEGAIQILRRAFAGDTAEALINDPYMVQQFPDRRSRLQSRAPPGAGERVFARDARPGGHHDAADLTTRDRAAPRGSMSLSRIRAVSPLARCRFRSAAAPMGSWIKSGKRRPAERLRRRQGPRPHGGAATERAGAVPGHRPQRHRQHVARAERPGRADARGTHLGTGQKGHRREPEIHPRQRRSRDRWQQGNLLAEGGELFRERVAADTGSKTAPMWTTAAAIPALV